MLYVEDHEDGLGIVEQAREDLRPLSGTTDTGSMGEHGESSGALVNGMLHGEDGGAEDSEEGETAVQPPPLLIASVVAPTAADAVDARRAAARLERTGREFQREWIREQEESHAVIADGEDGWAYVDMSPWSFAKPLGNRNPEETLETRCRDERGWPCGL
jgi:hypothetical protein